METALKTPTKPNANPHHPLALWHKVRTAYIHGEGSQRELAEKYGISFESLSDKARKEGWLARRQAFDLARLNSLVPEPTPTIEAPQARQAIPETPTAIMAEKLMSEIEECTEAIKNAETADEKDKLSRTRERAFRQWQVLTGMPNPGSRRPVKVKARASTDPIAPVEPAPNPPLPG